MVVMVYMIPGTWYVHIITILVRKYVPGGVPGRCILYDTITNNNATTEEQQYTSGIMLASHLAVLTFV